MNRYIDTTSEGMTKQANSRLNIYGTKSIDVNDANNIEIEHDGS